MLSVARDRLDRAGLRNVQLRQGDMFALPVERNAFDLVILHQVLHYLDDPSRALREAARTLRPGGRLLVVDFAPHAEESLRIDHAHRRLGFSPDEIAGFMADAGLDVTLARDLAPDAATAASSPCRFGWRATGASSPTSSRFTFGKSPDAPARLQNAAPERQRSGAALQRVL